jgi:hypothetical protein
VDNKANKARLAANVAAWQALGEEGHSKIEDENSFLYKDVEMEVSKLTVQFVRRLHLRL